ncbi:gamma subclass chorismate mutase AroQ [Iodobacter sp. CM08]|uniref:gamma subclass chorismate mutase AroQ n=1 Tax=Iodobacter sp. CM08 TaxID=3085902 RepID=UPI002981A4FF|nr:gamma subclass chorismate mutase AroQ [Iodobacter sp. CM08]MDW5418863.1 gamma subclass chorismate mutase AroQ [Iodobacter sp. CM08]
MRKTLIKLITSLCSVVLIVACAQMPSTDSTAQTQQAQDLLSLIAQRLAVAPLVAQSKWNSGAAINDPAREQSILVDVQKRAIAIELDPRFAAAFFQTQFDAGKLIQSQLHQQWRLQKQTPFTPAPDLAKDVRPVLDGLTLQLLIKIKTVQADLCQPETKRALNTATGPLAQFTPEVSAMALSTLQCP